MTSAIISPEDFPFILSRAPCRVSFFGGGTDYPAYYRQEGGAVLSTSIAQYVSLSCRYFPHFFPPIVHRVTWSHIESVTSWRDILHPSAREGLGYLGFDDERGVEIHYIGDLPARTGVGSSSAFSVALLQGLSVLKGDPLSGETLWQAAIDLEQNVLKEAVGSQDQVASAAGGLNRIEFHENGQIDVTPVRLSASRKKTLESRLHLVYSGLYARSEAPALAIIDKIPETLPVLRKMKDLVSQAESILCDEAASLDDFGDLLDAAWCLKKDLTAQTTNPAIDALYRSGRESGAIGGKLLGAGARGFVLFYVPDGKSEAFKTATSDYLHVPFRFDELGAHLVDIPYGSREP